MPDSLASAAGLTITIAEALWAARGLWALLIVLLLWRLTLHTREVAMYFRSRRLLSEQRRLLALTGRLAEQFDDVSDDRKAHADLDKRHRRIQHRLRALDRTLGVSSLDRASAP
jgi:hypothetical protein